MSAQRRSSRAPPASRCVFAVNTRAASVRYTRAAYRSPSSPSFAAQ